MGVKKAKDSTFIIKAMAIIQSSVLVEWLGIF